MANRAKKSSSEAMMAQRILVDNCLNDATVATELARYGYAPEVLREGAEMLQRLEAAVATQDAEYGDQIAATIALEQAWDKARHGYADTLALARVAFKADPDAQRALRLNGDRRNSLSGWLEDAKVFYAQLLGSALWRSALVRYGRDQKVLAQERALIDDVERLKSVQEREKGEARGATDARDKLLDETNAWFSDLREVVKVAFRSDPQKLERLGIVVLNQPRAARASKS